MELANNKPFLFERDARLIEVCRGGYCTLAALALYEYYKGRCEIWALYERDRPGNRHFFVRVNGWAVDMGGARPLIGMRQIYPGETYLARKTSKRQLDKEHFQNTHETSYLGREETGNSIVSKRIAAHLVEYSHWFELRTPYPYRKKKK